MLIRTETGRSHHCTVRISRAFTNLRSFKHPAPEYVRFERPPVLEYPEPVLTETGEGFEAQIKYFDNGVVSVELKLQFEADWDELIRLSNR